MSVTATGELRHSYLMSLLLSECATFQEVVGASSSLVARDSIAYPAAEDDGDGNPKPNFPRAVITETSEFTATKSGTSYWQYKGALEVTFQFVTPKAEWADNFTSQYNYYQNKVGAIIGEIQALAGTGEPVTGVSHLNVTEITLSGGPWYTPVAELPGNELPEVELPFAVWWSIYQMGFF